MAQDEHTTATEVNIDSFSDGEMVDHYVERTDVGLVEHEERAIERYFGEDGRLLDVGCGAGRTTAPLSDRGYDVVGIDISADMVERARALFPDLTFEIGDVTDLDYSDDAFEYVVFAHNGIDYVHPESERERAFREIRRVLTDDGVLVFSTHNAWYRYPALVSDHSFLRTFYVGNGNLKRFFRRYKVDVIEDDPLWTYLTTPPRQFRQLRRCGFDPVEVVGKRDGLARYFEAMPHFVAEPDSEQ